MSVEKNKPFRVEELHRDEWIPVRAKNAKGVKEDKIVRITKSTAEVMNIDSKDTKIRYTEISEKEFKAIRDKEKADAEAKSKPAEEAEAPKEEKKDDKSKK